MATSYEVKGRGRAGGTGVTPPVAPPAQFVPGFQPTGAAAACMRAPLPRQRPLRARGGGPRMTGPGQSPRDPRSLNQVGGAPGTPFVSCGSSGGGAKAALTCRSAPGVNLRRALRVGSWNILSLSDDLRLPLLSGELSRLVVRESYENLSTKLLPNNFFTNMFVKVCNNMC